MGKKKANGKKSGGNGKVDPAKGEKVVHVINPGKTV